MTIKNTLENGYTEYTMTETPKHVDFAKYAEFVDEVTSDASKDFLALLIVS